MAFSLTADKNISPLCFTVCTLQFPLGRIVQLLTLSSPFQTDGTVRASLRLLSLRDADGGLRHFRLELGVLSNRLVAERQGEALGIKKCSVSPPIFVSLLPANGISFTSFIHF
jgi:hypothetical protein